MFSAARTGLLNTLSSCRYFGSSVATRPASVPWFVDLPPSPTQAAPPISGSSQPAPPIPEDAPEILKYLHSQLVLSPHLDKSQLVVSPAVLPGPGPALPLKKPQGRRKRGGTYAGETAYEAVSGGVWSWVVMSQVKEGTEKRGAIESVVRLVRKSLLQHNPPVVLPKKSRNRKGGEWFMIDAGKFAVHILSKSAREKYFNPNSRMADSDWYNA